MRLKSVGVLRDVGLPEPTSKSQSWEAGARAPGTGGDAASTPAATGDHEAPHAGRADRPRLDDHQRPGLHQPLPRAGGRRHAAHYRPGARGQAGHCEGAGNPRGVGRDAARGRGVAQQSARKGYGPWAEAMSPSLSLGGETQTPPGKFQCGNGGGGEWMGDSARAGARGPRSVCGGAGQTHRSERERRGHRLDPSGALGLTEVADTRHIKNGQQWKRKGQGVHEAGGRPPERG